MSDTNATATATFAPALNERTIRFLGSLVEVAFKSYDDEHVIVTATLEGKDLMESVDLEALTEALYDHLEDERPEDFI
jgi:hypothetical protein